MVGVVQSFTKCRDAKTEYVIPGYYTLCDLAGVVNHGDE